MHKYHYIYRVSATCWRWAIEWFLNDEAAIAHEGFACPDAALPLCIRITRGQRVVQDF